MSGIPREVDDLMWLVAENGDPSAVDSFIHRYPAYRADLLRRLEMVRKLKEARPNTSIAPIPAFRMQPVRRSLPFRTGIAFAAAACLCLAAFGSYQLVLRAQAPAKVASNQGQTHMNSSQPWANSQTSSGNSSVPGPRRLSGTHESDIGERINGATAETPGDPPSSSVPPGGGVAPLGKSQSTAYDKVVTLHESRIKLSAALAKVASQSGLVLHFAPNFPDFDIVCEYPGVPAMKILEDMAATYGFSALRDGNSEVLLIPAPNKNPAPTQESPAPVQPQGPGNSGRPAKRGGEG